MLSVVGRARKIEAEFQRSVFADPSGAVHIEIDLSGVMRAAAMAGQLRRCQARLDCLPRDTFNI